ncbi:MAG: EAL domain-containing protein, partial [Bradymonadaceae bacterium]
MYRTKADEGSEIGIYEANQHLPDTEKLHYENELRKALDRGEFTVHYQPVIDLAAERVIGAEALARWQHPEQGLISPATFIPVAEETGLIVSLGYQILEQAAATVAGWPTRAPNLSPDRPFRLAVNLSGHQYGTDDLVPRIREIAAETDLGLDRLVLEITESVLMTGDSKLQSLRTDGARVAIDDF